ncbi:MAG: DUF938 domain-containing protein [Hyphomicrobiaceae bacterium]
MSNAKITGGLGHGWDGKHADERLDAPPFHRNKEAILEVVRRHLTMDTGDVLEIGSGTGQHAVNFAAAFPSLTWHPSDPDARHRTSIDAWRREAELNNIRPALNLDACATPWSLPEGVSALAGVICINVLHIAPWDVSAGLFHGAGRVLEPGAPLMIYGPFKRDGQHTAPSNAAFDDQLRRSDPVWGIRDICDLERLAGDAGLALVEVNSVPANNFVLVFKGHDR